MIRRAKPSEAEILTRISFESKAHWGYPEAWFAIWDDELTISTTDIQNNDTFSAFEVLKPITRHICENMAA